MCGVAKRQVGSYVLKSAEDKQIWEEDVSREQLRHLAAMAIRAK